MSVRGQSGLGLVGAIFMVIVVSVLTAAITRSVQSTAAASSLEIVSQRAFLAAESGAQLALNATYAPAGAGACADTTWNLQTIGLPGCQAITECRSTTVAGVPYYTFESAGRCDNGGVVAERVVRVRAQ